MSLVVEISTYNEDIGVSNIIRGFANAIFDKIGEGENVRDYINNTKCRGILQNDINIGFSNNWGQTLYQGLYQAMSDASNATVLGTSAFGKIAKTTYDLSNTALNMGGISLVGAGAASTRIYQGSTISGFTVTMKWYTPKDNTYIDSLKALMILGFPSYRTPQTYTGNYGNADGEGEIGITNILGKLSDTLPSLASYNPPVVKVRVTDLSRLNENSTSDIFNLHPLVISSINIGTTRETFTSNGHKIPIVITATVGFEFYQIRGNQGYTKEPLMVAGVPVLGAMRNG